MYYLYILECSDSTLYTGITTDVDRRFEEHKSGTASKYTKRHGAKKILYTEEHDDRSAASKREYEVKQLTRAQKLMLIQQA